MTNIHVAFVRPDIIKNLRSGEKKIESRLSVHMPPAWSVQAGDLILFKATGGEIELRASVINVHKFKSLASKDIETLAELFSPEMGTTPSDPYWQTKLGSRYAVFIELQKPQSVEFPSHLTPRGVRSAWISNFTVDQSLSARLFNL